MKKGFRSDVEFGAHGIDEVVEAVLYRCENRAAAVGRREYFDACFVAFDVEVGLHHDWFAIDVHHRCFRSEDGELVGAEAVDIGVFIDLLGEELYAYDRRLNG